MIKYYKLFDLLNRRNMKKTDLLKIMSSPTLAKLSKGEIVKTDIINKICEFLQCQPGDIMEYIELNPGNDEKTNEKYIIVKKPKADDELEQDIFTAEEFKNFEEETV